jgi:hypothetical protein
LLHHGVVMAMILIDMTSDIDCNHLDSKKFTYLDTYIMFFVLFSYKHVTFFLKY